MFTLVHVTGLCTTLKLLQFVSYEVKRPVVVLQEKRLPSQ